MTTGSAATHKRKVHIFISHKHEDGTAAREVKTLLSKLAPEEDLQVFLSDDIRGGENWFDKIQQNLVDSNLLLLLYTSRLHDWDWCMYEAGLFTGLAGESRRKVVCLSGSGDVPQPLKHLQSVLAHKQDAVFRLLEGLFLRRDMLDLDKPLLPNAPTVREALRTAANELSRLVCRKPENTEYFGEHLFVLVHDPEDLGSDQERPAIPSDSVCTAAEDTVWRLFGKKAKHGNAWTWGELERELRKNGDDQRWIDELARAMRCARDLGLVSSINATFRSLDDRENYHPMLYRADWLSDGSIQFKITFDKTVGWDVNSFPDHMRTITTGLVMASRFRYELMIHFRDWIRATPEKAVARIRAKIVDIEQEADSRGLLNRQGVLDVFSAQQDLDHIASMFDRWYEVRTELFDALDRSSLPRITEVLDELNEMNQQFLVMASRRYADLVAGISRESSSTHLASRSTRISEASRALGRIETTDVERSVRGRERGLPDK